MNRWLCIAAIAILAGIGILGWGPETKDPEEVRLIGAAIIACLYGGTAALFVGALPD